jgi:curved DNA binding protein
MSGADSDHEEEVLDLSKSDVVTKYKAAAEITNGALAAVIAALKPGAKIVDICTLGDKHIEEAAAKNFKGKKLEKGVAFPTSVSVNNILGHVSPQADDTAELKEGDLVKIDLGAHIDGFIAVAAHSLLLQGDSKVPVEGQQADVLQAAATALEAALRLIRPGKLVSEVAPVLQKVVEAYGCNMVEGVFSHEMKQFVIDGNKCVLNKPQPDAKVAEDTFEENEVYAVDVVVSTGDGKGRIVDEKETTIYKRVAGEGYKLKLAASRSVFGEVIKKHPSLPFTLRGLEAKNARLGLPECVNHDLLQPYPVLREKQSALVAQFKSTVLLMPSGSDRITSAPLQDFKSEKTIEDEDVKKLLQSSLKPKKKSGKKKAGKKADPAAANAEKADTEAKEAK